MAERLIIDSIFADYEEDRANEAVRRDRRVERVYADYPRIREIDAEINAVGLAAVQSIMKNPSEAAAINAGMKKRISELTAEKNSIIAANGIDADFAKIKYKCAKCGDTGYIGREKCECFYERLKEKSYVESNMAAMIKSQSFENFRFDYYTGDARARIEVIYKNAKRFCDEFETEPKSVIMKGGVGLGKTYMSSCIAKELIDKGYSVIYMRASEMFDLIEAKRFGRASQDDIEIIKRIYSDDLLIIDDLGTEIPTKATAPILFDVVSDRLLKQKKMIISTNLSYDELSKKYSRRLVSRIYDGFMPFEFIGTDIRETKLLKD